MRRTNRPKRSRVGRCKRAWSDGQAMARTLKAKQLYHSLVLNSIVGPLVLLLGTPMETDGMEYQDCGLNMTWHCIACWKSGV